jgi:hypothetical protein
MRLRALVAACAAIILTTVLSAPADADWDCQVKGSHELAREAWDYPHKRAGKIAHVRYLARCSGERLVRRHIADARKAYKRAKQRDQAESALTPYDCGSAGNFAIPCYIVECESRYDWGAYNPSGAAGVYQIMPEHGRPWPADSEAARLEHHRIASELYAGGAGASNWVCA